MTGFATLPTQTCLKSELYLKLHRISTERIEVFYRIYIDLIIGKPNIFLVCNGSIYPIPEIDWFEFIGGEWNIKSNASQKDVKLSLRSYEFPSAILDIFETR